MAAPNFRWSGPRCVGAKARARTFASQVHAGAYSGGGARPLNFSGWVAMHYFEAAVSMALAQVLGALVGPLWLLLPVNAAVSIWRRRRNRPGSSCWFAYVVILGWVSTLVAWPALVLRGGRYGENGPSPQRVVVGALLVITALAAVHLALVVAGSCPRADANAT
jgi:hypothetical protein